MNGWRQFLALLALTVPLLAAAQSQQDILRREALRSDDRMYANYRAFAAAVRGALPSEPRMSMLEVGENTAFAMVRSDDGKVRQFAWLEGVLQDPAPTPRRDDATDALAMANRFGFGDISLDQIRATLRKHRTKPGRYGDTAPNLRIGYNRLLERWLVVIEVGSIAAGGLDAIAYDLKTGGDVDLMGIVRKHNAEVEVHNRKVDEMHRADEAARKREEEEARRLAKILMYPNGRAAHEALVATLGREPRLKNVVLNEVQVAMTVWDERAGNVLVTYNFNRRMELMRADKLQSDITGCDSHYSGREVDWDEIPAMVDQAYAVLGITAPAMVRVDVERPERCGPIQAQVSIEKNRVIRSAYFDTSGRLFKADR